VAKLRLALLLTALSLALPAAAAARVPQGFIGMNVDGPLLTGQVNLDAQLGVMARGGVESVRVTLHESHVASASYEAAVP